MTPKAAKLIGKVVIVFAAIVSVSLCRKLSPEATLATLQALDDNGSGKVEQSDITAFSEQQGLDVKEALAEFAELDRNGDGVLDADEVSFWSPGDESPTESPLIVSPTDLPSILDVPSVTAAPFQLKTAAAQPLEAISSNEYSVAEDSNDDSVAATLSDQSVPFSSQPAEQGLTVMPPENDGVAGEQPDYSVAFSPRHAEQSVTLTAPEIPFDIKNMTAWLEGAAKKATSLAAKTTTETFAREAEKVMEHRAKDEKDAAAFEIEANELHANATALLLKAADSSKEAADEAIADVMLKSLERVRELERDADNEEARAKDNHAKASVAMTRAMSAQKELSASVRRLLRVRKSSGGQT